jgi:hypothetical protein
MKEETRSGRRNKRRMHVIKFPLALALGMHLINARPSNTSLHTHASEDREIARVREVRARGAWERECDDRARTSVMS